MASSPRWKVYLDGQYVASCKEPLHAAALVGAIGGEVRLGHAAAQTVWREGGEHFGANESWDAAAALMVTRAGGA